MTSPEPPCCRGCGRAILDRTLVRARITNQNRVELARDHPNWDLGLFHIACWERLQELFRAGYSDDSLPST